MNFNSKEKILRLPVVVVKTGLSRNTIYNMMGEGTKTNKAWFTLYRMAVKRD